MNWYAKKSTGRGQGLVIDEDAGRTVAVAYDEQDTELLAAAPELLAALIELLCVEPYESGRMLAARNAARAAIAKAEGGAA